LRGAFPSAKPTTENTVDIQTIIIPVRTDMDIFDLVNDELLPMLESLISSYGEDVEVDQGDGDSDPALSVSVFCGEITYSAKAKEVAE